MFESIKKKKEEKALEKYFATLFEFIMWDASAFAYALEKIPNFAELFNNLSEEAKNKLHMGQAALNLKYRNPYKPGTKQHQEFCAEIENLRKGAKNLVDSLGDLAAPFFLLWLSDAPLET